MAEGWTLETLKTYIESKIEGVEKNAALALSASEKAITKAEAAAEKRADASNEIRAAMVDQQKNFANLAQTNLQFANLTQRIEAVERAIASSKDKSAGVGQTWGLLAAVIFATAAMVGLIFVVLRGVGS